MKADGTTIDDLNEEARCLLLCRERSAQWKAAWDAVQAARQAWFRADDANRRAAPSERDQVIVVG